MRRRPPVPTRRVYSPASPGVQAIELMATMALGLFLWVLMAGMTAR